MVAFITGNKGTQWLNKLALFSTLFLIFFSTSSYSFDLRNTPIPTQVSIENNGSQLYIIAGEHQWELPIEHFSILSSEHSVEKHIDSLPFFYRGHVRASDNSWVRLQSDVELATINNLEANSPPITGNIFANGNLFELRYSQTKGHTLTAIANPTPQATKLLSRLKTQHDWSEVTQAENQQLPLKAIKIGIMVDSQYDEYYQGHGLAEALSVINAVDGLFQEQLGLAIMVERFKIADDPETDPLRDYSGSMEEMLSAFRQIRQSDSEFPADLALVHLFTGYRAPDQLIGISWINTVCQLDGYDISISTPYTFSKLLTAHEIAHNLGAMHDESAQCPTDATPTENGIMWSELSSATQSNFSQCSRDVMRETLSLSVCAQNDIDMALTVNSSPTPYALEQQIEVSAVNWDASRSSGQVSSITHFPEGTVLNNLEAGCYLTDSTMTCQHGTIAASSHNSFSVTASLPNANASMIRSELYFSDFTDSNKTDNRVNIQLNVTQESASTQETLPVFSEDIGAEVALGASARSGSLGPLSILLLSALLSVYRAMKRTTLKPVRSFA